MAKIFGGTFSRRGPDLITEELASMFSKGSTFEFKPLFDILHATLRERKAASGGEEMLRLRVYEKLQELVRQGVVKKTITKAIKTYKGVPGPLGALRLKMKELRDEWARRLVAAPVVS